MLAANEAYRNPVRQELDHRLLTEALGAGRGGSGATGDTALSVVSGAYGYGD